MVGKLEEGSLLFTTTLTKTDISSAFIVPNSYVLHEIFKNGHVGYPFHVFDGDQLWRMSFRFDEYMCVGYVEKKWLEFVKNRNLTEGDTISFYRTRYTDCFTVQVQKKVEIQRVIVDEKHVHDHHVLCGIQFGKRLMNEKLSPGLLAQEAEKMANEFVSTKVIKVLQFKEINKSCYDATSVVHILHVSYKHPGEIKSHLAIVGDTCTGGSGILGIAKALSQITPTGVEVHFVLSSTERITVLKPGDIVTLSNGKSIEVNNIDAESRLTLAEALVYACEQGVEKIVDLSALTEACVPALGPSIAGIFTPNDELAQEVIVASEDTGEKIWRMPMKESYWDLMKSEVADMVSTGGRQGESITAALFLKQFVDEKVKWMHIDMAGPVWNGKKMATGFSISTLIQWVLKNCT